MILVLSFGRGQAKQIFISASACSIQRVFVMMLELLLFKMSLVLFAYVDIGRLGIYFEKWLPVILPHKYFMV